MEVRVSHACESSRCLVVLGLCPVEYEVGDGRRCLFFAFGDGVDIHVLGERDSRMPEAFRHDLWLDACCEAECGVGVAEVVVIPTSG